MYYRYTAGWTAVRTAREEQTALLACGMACIYSRIITTLDQITDQQLQSSTAVLTYSISLEASINRCEKNRALRRVVTSERNTHSFELCSAM